MNKVYIGIAVMLFLLLLAVGGTVLAGGSLFWFTRSPTASAPPPDITAPAEPGDPPPPSSSSTPPSGTVEPSPGGEGKLNEGIASAEEGEGVGTNAEGEGEGEGTEAGTPTKGSSCADTISGVTRHSATHYTLSRDFFNRYIRDQGTAQGQGKATWRENKKKQTVGLRVYGLKCAPKVAGLKNGDVIRTIDDRKLNSSTAAIVAYNGILNSSRITVGLRRDGQGLTIRYDIE